MNERERFEKWARENYEGFGPRDFALCADPRCVDVGKHYARPDIDLAFKWGQAALSAATPAPQFIRELVERFALHHKMGLDFEQAVAKLTEEYGGVSPVPPNNGTYCIRECEAELGGCPLRDRRRSVSTQEDAQNRAAED